MEINTIENKRFKKYGKIIKDMDFSSLIKELQKLPIPDHVVYEPSEKSLENLPIKHQIEKVLYGELPIQIGYCNGHNSKLNAVEYHRCSEIIIAASDVILLLGMQQDIEEDLTYDTSLMEAFLLPKGYGVELYATTLHYAPCSVDGNGFQVAIVLPLGTNYPLKNKPCKDKTIINEDLLLVATNKWLISHPESKLDAFIGLKGINLSV